ncbi:helix-turn-helix domain-containing protein [Aerococcus mictus]|uniref:helix-turn-helix domain-containing protein n=1 Tax=Aerococcus mictus TaxID=2976810 RepID=UPI00398C28EB
MFLILKVDGKISKEHQQRKKKFAFLLKKLQKKNSVSEIAKDLGVTRATVYKYINSEEVKNDRGSNKEDLVISYIKKYPKKNVSEIAKQLGISRTTVYKYKKKYGL